MKMIFSGIKKPQEQGILSGHAEVATEVKKRYHMGDTAFRIVLSEK
jgi:hypothetical protein